MLLCCLGSLKVAAAGVAAGELRRVRWGLGNLVLLLYGGLLLGLNRLER